MTPEPRRKKRRRRRKRRRLKVWMRLLLMIILAGVMALMAAICVLYRIWVVRPALPNGGAGDGSWLLENGDVDAVQPKVSGERRSEDVYTILLVGTDIISNSTDTIMLATYDVTNQKATVMSIPRDTLVNVKSGSAYTRINSVYSLYGGGEEGMNALTLEVAELVGFVPDFQVMINWELVGQMVDAIGGVEYDVPYHMEYYDPGQDLNIYIEAGPQVLDGEHAMQLVRWRKNNPGVSGGGSGSDITRLEVQHGFLTAALKQTLQIQNVAKIGQLARLFSENVKSQLTVENLFWFGSRAVFGGLNADDVEFTTMPFYYFGAYVCPQQDQLLTVINEKLNPYTTEVTVQELDLIIGNDDGSLSSTTGVLADPSAAAAAGIPSGEPDP